MPHPFAITAVCAQAGLARRRPIKIQPSPHLTGHPGGLWLAGTDADYIFHTNSTSAVHRDHIILHELGHILCEHEGLRLNTYQVARQLAPDLEPELIQHLLARSGFSTRQEREAERFADLVMARARANSRQQRLRDDHDVLERMHATFGQAPPP